MNKLVKKDIINFKEKLEEIISNKNVLFVTTKKISYIRNSQEIELIKNKAKSNKIISSSKSNYFLRVLSVYFQLLFLNTKNYDIVFIGFAPQLVLPFFGYKFKNSILIIDFFISVYDTFVNDRKVFTQQSIMAKAVFKLDVFTLKNPDYIITDTIEHSKYFINDLKADKDKIIVYYIEADKKIYNTNNYIKKENGHFRILYFGSILPLQGIDIILNSIELIRNEDIEFIIIGPLKYDKHLQLTERKNVKLVNWLTQEKLAEEILNSDLCLAGHFNNFIEKAKRTIPGKAYIYNEMNVPMILGDNKANRELFNENQEKIFFVKMGDSKALSEKIIEIYKEYKGLKKDMKQ
ncbi:MAG: glycosyltransferase [Clostridiales bacterium]